MAEADISDFLTLQERYGGQYIALCGKQIVAHGKTYRETYEAVERMNLRDVRYQFVQPAVQPA